MATKKPRYEYVKNELGNPISVLYRGSIKYHEADLEKMDSKEIEKYIKRGIIIDTKTKKTE